MNKNIHIVDKDNFKIEATLVFSFTVLLLPISHLK